MYISPYVDQAVMYILAILDARRPVGQLSMCILPNTSEPICAYPSSAGPERGASKKFRSVSRWSKRNQPPRTRTLLDRHSAVLALVTTAASILLLWAITAMKSDDMTLEQLCQLFAYTPKGRPLDSKEVAAIFGVNPGTPEQWRFRGEGPRYFQPPGSRRVWYAERDVLSWLASGAKQSTSEQVAV